MGTTIITSKALLNPNNTGRSHAVSARPVSWAKTVIDTIGNSVPDDCGS
jgi:hypothetical protein